MKVCNVLVLTLLQVQHQDQDKSYASSSDCCCVSSQQYRAVEYRCWGWVGSLTAGDSCWRCQYAGDQQADALTLPHSRAQPGLTTFQLSIKNSHLNIPSQLLIKLNQPELFSLHLFLCRPSVLASPQFHSDAKIVKLSNQSSFIKLKVKIRIKLNKNEQFITELNNNKSVLSDLYDYKEKKMHFYYLKMCRFK